MWTCPETSLVNLHAPRTLATCCDVVQCYTSEWAGYAVYSLVICGVYVVGVCIDGTLVGILLHG